MSVPQEEKPNADATSGVFRAVSDSMDAVQHLRHDPASIDVVEALIGRLKHLLHEEKHTYTLTHQSSEKRKKIESLHNLIQFLELQGQKVHRAAHRNGLKYYLASIFNMVLGDEVSRIGQSMESKLQSWLDQHGVRELADTVSNGSIDAHIKGIASFELVVRKGFDPLLQDTILSCGIAEKLAALLEPGAASWDVQKQAAFALCVLLDFNKDIFVSLVLMAKVVGNVIRLMDTEPDQNVLILVGVLKDLISAGQTLIVDEVYVEDGVAKLVSFLDCKWQPLKHAAADCVLEMAYYGRMEVVQEMFELEVIQKLARLQQSSVIAAEIGNVTYSKQDRSINLPPSNGSTVQMQGTNGENVLHPFSNVVTRFALNLAIGAGLRKRERRALKEEFLKQIKEIVQDDVELANITAEVLWAP